MYVCMMMMMMMMMMIIIITIIIIIIMMMIILPMMMMMPSSPFSYIYIPISTDRKALLLYHPDKTGRGDRDEVFIQVQKAYETLSGMYVCR